MAEAAKLPSRGGSAAAGGCGAGRGPVRADQIYHRRRLQGAAAAGRPEPGRAGREDPARRRCGIGGGGGRPRRGAGRGRRRPAGARPGQGRLRRPVGGRQRRVAGRGRGRGGRRGAVRAAHRRPRVRRRSDRPAAGDRCARCAGRRQPGSRRLGRGHQGAGRGGRRGGVRQAPGRAGHRLWRVPAPPGHLPLPGTGRRRG